MVFILPEILDQIFEYIDSHIYSNLYDCLFVNHQFYEATKRILYRDLHFRRVARKVKEEKLWNTLNANCTLLLHIRKICLDFTPVSSTPEIPGDTMSPTFEKRVEFIARHATNLRRVDLTTRMWTKSYQDLDAVLLALYSVQGKPELSISLSERKESINDDQIITLGREIRRIAGALPVTGLYFFVNMSPARLGYLAPFSHLRSLRFGCECARRFADSFNEQLDLARTFKFVPLESLEIDCVEQIVSFPTSLKTLKLGEYSTCRHPLSHDAWLAVCELRKLHKFSLISSTRRPSRSARS